MYRICVKKATGKLIEMQSGGDYHSDVEKLPEEEREDFLLDYQKKNLDVLRQNAINGGYREDQIEVKFVDEEEWQKIQEASKPIPTYTDLRRPEYPPIGDQLDNIVKTLKYLSGKGIDIGPEGKLEVSLCMAVKAKYPKPTV